MNTLNLIGYLYGVAGAVFLLSRKIIFNRYLKKNGKTLEYGSTYATIKFQASNLFFETITFILLAAGFIYGVIGEYFNIEIGLNVLLIINIPEIIFIYLIGFTVYIIDVNGMLIILHPRIKTKYFLMILLLIMIWSVVSLLILLRISISWDILLIIFYNFIIMSIITIITLISPNVLFNDGNVQD